MDRLNGITNAIPERRYMYFLSACARSGKVWVLAAEYGLATWDANGVLHLIVYPSRAAAEQFCENGEEAAPIELREFLARCDRTREDPGLGFMVYPNGLDAYMVNTEKMICDLEAELARIERS